MERAYFVYGLRVLADASIPALLPSSVETGPIDVRIRVNRLPPWWSDEMATADAEWYRGPLVNGERPRLTVWKIKTGWYRLLYFDGAEFIVAPEGGEIWCVFPPGAVAEDPVPYLAGPVFGFVLRLRGICCLHASAIRVGEKVIAISGPGGAGKSTTAAAFGKLGHAVVSDDITALVERDGKFFVQSGYPRLCLWPDAAASLYFASERLPRIVPEEGMNRWWDKRYLDLTSEGYQFEEQALPLAAIYLLNEREEGAPHPAIETVSASTAVVKLASNTYMNYLLDSDLRSREFGFLSRVVAGLPVRRVTPQADPGCLPRLCEAILEDYSQFSGALNA